MVDYAVDGSFDLFKNDYNDIAEVDGIEEFEQNLTIKLHYQMEAYVQGYKDIDALTEKVSLLATRVARQEDVLDRIVSITVSDLPKKSDTLEVEIIYESEDDFTEIL